MSNPIEPPSGAPVFAAPSEAAPADVPGLSAVPPTEEAHSSVIHLIWRGGKHARVAIPRPRFLEDVPEAGDPTSEDPGNLVIEGDNRQAMVSLLSQYAGRIDVVLTDPPYNTGKRDF